MWFKGPLEVPMQSLQFHQKHGLGGQDFWETETTTVQHRERRHKNPARWNGHREHLCGDTNFSVPSGTVLIVQDEFIPGPLSEPLSKFNKEYEFRRWPTFVSIKKQAEWRCRPLIFTARHQKTQLPALVATVKQTRKVWPAAGRGTPRGRQTRRPLTPNYVINIPLVMGNHHCYSWGVESINGTYVTVHQMTTGPASGAYHKANSLSATAAIPRGQAITSGEPPVPTPHDITPVPSFRWASVKHNYHKISVSAWAMEM